MDAWFSVRCVFCFPGGARSTYEERITLWRVSTAADAVAAAEAEARTYAEAVDGEYLGLAQVYSMPYGLGHGVEVFSLMRDSTLVPDAYLDAFFDTGDERQGVIDAP